MQSTKRAQHGFTLVELMIYSIISILLAAALLWPRFVEHREALARIQATHLKTLSSAAATFTTVNYNNLVNNAAVAGYANIYAPTVAELRAAGLLLPNFNETNVYHGAYAIKIERTPASCGMAGLPDCDIWFLTSITNPVINPMTGNVDGVSLGAAVEAAGDDAGYSPTSTPGSIVGANGVWSIPNPAGNIAGILAIRGGYGSSGMAQFMRRDGQLAATGDQDMGGQNVKNVNTLNSTAIVNRGNATVGGALGVAGQTTTNGITNTGNITNSGSLQTGNTTINGTAAITGAATVAGNLAVTGQTTTRGITNSGNITNTGDVQTGRLYLTTIITNGASCAGYTGYQAATVAGSIASCINGVWQTPAADIPPPSPCRSITVSFQGCTGSVPYTQSGDTASVAMTSGSGYATYSCNNGSWAFISGNCTPPPAGCPGQTISWNGSASCNGYSPAMNHGGAQYVNASGSNNGNVYARCSNGVIIQSSPTCSVSTSSYSNPTSQEGYEIAANPSNRSSFCQSKGKSPYGSGNTETDKGGQNRPVCYTIDSALRCIAPGNCTDNAYGNPGCYIQTKVTCQ